ncbi:hypothetical protein [Geomonas subterranea]|uniref:Uncharacterized protein n=1 Tax=Geomonas subterranea TaxID=2847989 RepID=A0ABX8LGP0_9BACT|nr:MULTISPECIES: hypothetical protein [Geomonas]QXE90898.1 hypothetical protein KP001_21405 [Geomonas subterranea]QXM11017.1 hypothetical protein KP002_07870 [Geomonas subterranea]
MWHHLKPLALCAATLTLAAGCAHTTGKAPESAPATPAAEPAPAVKEVPAIPGADINKGTITEVFQAGRYSYVSVDSGSAKTWFAIPTADVKVGQQVEVKPGMLVTNYLAKSLNRTFDSIYFSDELTIKEVVKPASPGKKLPAWHSPVTPTAKTTAGVSVAGKILEVVNGGEYNYARVDQGETDIWVAVPSADKVVQGETVKFLPGQLVKNFGSAALNRNFDKVIFSGGVDKQGK